jgi:hypothetical protein
MGLLNLIVVQKKLGKLLHSLEIQILPINIDFLVISV